MKSNAEYILSGLRQRGMPDHIARGFVMNFQDESGLDPGIEEKEANVHGTKGFGLAQWTGERRGALVSYANQHGKPVADLDTQMDFLMQELSGPESAAWEKIKGARTSGEAGAAVVNSFLRPAEEHRRSREARYLRDNDNAISFNGFQDVDAHENAGLDYQTAYEAPRTVLPPTYLEEKSREPEPYSSWFDMVGASYRSGSFTDAAWRHWTEGVVDPDFEIGEDRAAELVKHVPEHYQDYIMTAGSEQMLQERLRWMHEDIESQQKLSAGGWSATAAGFAAGVIDPIPLVVGIATGGVGGALMKGGMAARMAVGGAMGAVENAGLELVNQEAFDNPNADPAMAAAFGAAFGALGGALARGPMGHAGPEAARAFRLAGDANAGKMREHADPLITGRDDSINAARNTETLEPLMPAERAYDTEVQDADAPKGFGGRLRFDATGQMTTSDQPLVRVIGAHLAEETAGFTDHSVVPDSAASRATALHRKFLGNFASVHTKAEAEYVREVAGVRNGTFHPMKAAQAQADFNRAVVEWVMDRNPSPDTHPTIAKAGAAFRRGMDEYRDEIERAGLAVLNRDPHYVPLVSDARKIADIDTRFEESAVHELIAQAIRHHSPNLSPEVVGRMAKGYWKNIRLAGWGMESDIDRAMSTGDRAAFKKSLLDSLEGNEKLTPEQVDAAFDAVTGALDGTGKDPNAASSRGVKALKKRTLMDYTFQATVRDRKGNMVPLRIMDFFQQDAGDMFSRYSRAMSGRIALADTKIENPSKPGYWITEGLKSEADLAKLKEAVKEEARRMGKDPVAKTWRDPIENIDFLWKRVAGVPVWDQSTAAAKTARRIKQAQFVRLMSNMGLNQIQEGWKIFVMTGYRAALDQMPSIKNMVRGANTGKYDRKALLEELQDMTGLGVEGMFSTRSLRLDEARLGESRSGRIGRAVDGTLDYMSEITSSISLMRTIHTWQTNRAGTLIVQQMANMARDLRTGDGGFDFSRLKPRDRDRLNNMGLGTKDAELLFSNLLTHAELDGRRIVQMNHHRWDPAAVSKFRVFVGRYVDRLVQANDVGGLSKWMSRPVASMFVQFRSFVAGAWSKSLLWALNHGAVSDPRMVVLIAGEIVMGAAIFALRAAPSALVGEDGWEKYKEKILDPKNLIANGFARSATASLLPTLIDSAMRFTPAGPQFEDARSSGTPTQAWTGLPVVDQINAAAKFSSGAMEAAFTEKPFTQGTAKAGLRAFAPWGNWLPVAAGFAAMTQGLPER